MADSETPRAFSFQIKPTGEIAADRAGALQYLGREIVRYQDEGPLTLGLPATYYDQVEEALEMKLKPVQNPPRLERCVDQEEQLLSERDWVFSRTYGFVGNKVRQNA